MRSTFAKARIALSVSLLCATAAAEDKVWTEATSGEPGENVTVVVKASTDLPTQAIALAFKFSLDDLTYLGTDFSLGLLETVTKLHFVNDRLVPDELCIVTREMTTGPHLPAAQNWEFCRIYFRVRAHAAPGECLASLIANSTKQPWDTSFVREGFPVWPTIVPGTVTVKPSSRPLPPDLFTCRQYLASVKLDWQNSAAYDELLLERDGQELARLGGDATSYVDPSPPLGAREYALTGLIGANRTVTVRYRITVQTPAAPPVKELACTSAGGTAVLSWKLGAEYTSLDIRRNGSPLATIAGDSTTFQDPAKPEGTVFYEVIAYVDLVPSVPTPCVVDGIWTVRLGSAEVPAGGGEITVPVYCTNPEATQGFVFGFVFDPTRIRVKGHSIEGTALERYADFMRFDMLRTDFARFAFEFCTPGCFSVPPAVDSCYVKVIVEVLPAAQEGEVIPLELRHGLGSPPHDICFVPSPAVTCIRAQLVNGEIVVGDPKVKSVKNLATSPASRKADHQVSLTWLNGEPYDSIEVERNGVKIQTLSGGSEGATDQTPGAGIYWYRVRGVRAGEASPWAIHVHTELPGVTLFKRGDTNADGDVNVADGVAAFAYLFTKGPAVCQDAVDVNDDGRLNVADVIFLLSYIFRGTEAPRSPGPLVRWYDPTPDTLGCAQETP